MNGGRRCAFPPYKFYDVNEGTVEILAIIAKSDARTWLERFGEST